MEARIRRAVPSDAAVIAAVHIRSWQSAYRGLLPDSYLDQLGLELERRTQFWSSVITSPTIPGNEIWVVDISVSEVDSESQSEVKGFATIGPTRDSDLAGAGEVYAIYLDPQSWGQGLGRALFAHVSDRLAALEYSTAMLWVLESNARARRFYELAGWTADGATRVETRPGFELHDVRYRKSLP
jgi:ribosomal protein S18 acetylase RimI-like enzyme